MPVPDYQAFMLPILRSFAAGAGSVQGCLPDLVRELGITQEEAEMLLPSGKKTVVQDRAHWARTYLSKAGLLTSPKRNVHVLTDRGRAVLARKPERVDNALLEQFPEFGEWRRLSAGDRGEAVPAPMQDPGPQQTSPDEALERAFVQINAALAAELREEVAKLTPRQFERLIRQMAGSTGSSSRTRSGWMRSICRPSATPPAATSAGRTFKASWVR